MTQRTTRQKTRKPLSPPLYRLNLGTWGRFYVWDSPHNFRMPRIVGSGAVKRLHKVCLHCLKPFKTNREEQRFCKGGCRTYNNRLKRDAIIRWMIEQGIPRDTALDTMDVSGLAVMGRKMESMGYVWNGQSWGKK
jgi:hypothetical protein